MSIDLVTLSTILLLKSPYSVLLSVWMVGCGCGWTSSPSVLRLGTAVLEFKNNDPSSASSSDDIALRMIVDRLGTVPFFGEFSSSFNMKLWPPVRLRALF